MTRNNSTKGDEKEEVDKTNDNDNANEGRKAFPKSFPQGTDLIFLSPLEGESEGASLFLLRS